jgi:beta-lactamase regulating signal transducer with metallopeptidase domain
VASSPATTLSSSTPAAATSDTAAPREKSESYTTAMAKLGLPNTANLLIAAWGMGALLLAVPFALAVWRLRDLRRRGVPWIEGEAIVGPLAADAGVAQRISLLIHEDISAPLTCGVVTPTILLPVDASAWDRAALRRALVHELEHVRRRDWFVHLASRLVCALYWFHPLAWIAFNKLTLEAERACDDAVLAHDDSTGYAQQLVSLAKRMARGSQPALAMANRSDLSARIAAILDARQPRGRIRLVPASVGAVLVVACLVAIAPVKAVTATILTTADQETRSRERSEQAGSRVSGRLGRAMVEAAAEGDLQSVRELIDAGGDVNANVDGDGTPLIAAARAGEIAIVSLLLDRGADPNLPVSGDGAPLIMAAREGHLAVVQLLLDRGANVDLMVPGDENALIQASGEGHLKVVQLLLARGANPNARVWAERAWERRIGEWRTPLSVAQRGGHSDVVAALRAAGAVP